MNGQRIRRISIWLVVSLYLLACALPLMTTPTVPTQMPVGTVIAQTADAAQTQTAIYLPTITLTPTPTPTSTPTKTPTSSPTLVPLIILPFLWTATPTVTFSLTQAGTASSEENGTDGGQEDDEDDEDEKSDYSSVVDKEWACTVLQRSPADGAIIGRGVRFSAVWTLLNRGTKTWPNYGVDFLFKSGLRNDGRARNDLPSTVISGGTITLYVTFTAPKAPGVYRSNWTLKVGRTSFCKMGIIFEVK